MGAGRWAFFVASQRHLPLAIALHVQHSVAINFGWLIRLGLFCRPGLEGHVRPDEFDRVHKDLKLLSRRLLKYVREGLGDRLTALRLIAILIPGLAVGSEQSRDS